MPLREFLRQLAADYASVLGCATALVVLLAYTVHTYGWTG